MATPGNAWSVHGLAWHVVSMVLHGSVSQAQAWDKELKCTAWMAP